MPFFIPYIDRVLIVNYNRKNFSAQCSKFCNKHDTFSKNCYSCSFDRYRTTLNLQLPFNYILFNTFKGPKYACMFTKPCAYNDSSYAQLYAACVLMVHLYLCLPDRCGHKIQKSKCDRQCKIGQKENVCLFCSYVFSVRTGQADRGINAPLKF